MNNNLRIPRCPSMSFSSAELSEQHPEPQYYGAVAGHKAELPQPRARYTAPLRHRYVLGCCLQTKDMFKVICTYRFNYKRSRQTAPNRELSIKECHLYALYIIIQLNFMYDS